MTVLLDDETRDVAAPALSAYNAMEATKRRHFDYLNLLDSKRKKFNLQATPEEKALLGSLLADHDYSVSSFKLAAQALQTSAPQTHVLLFQYIGMLNEIFNHSATSSESSH